MFLRKNPHFLALLVLVGSLGIILNIACERKQTTASQRVQLHRNHLQPLFKLLASFEKSPAQTWAEETNKMFDNCDVLAATIPANAHPLTLFKNLQCNPEKNIVKSIAHFNFKSYRWQLEIIQSKSQKLSGNLYIRPTSKASQKSLLLPGNEPVNFSFLNIENSLFSIHGNSRDGRGLYGLLLDNNQVQNLVGLGTIMGSLLSDSRWAAALYPPTQKSKAPLLALAAGLSSDTVKNNLVTQFEKALTQQYRLQSRPVEGGYFSGKCFSHIPLFPALAPCVVIFSQMALVTWNEETLKMAAARPEKMIKTEASIVGQWDWNAIEKANAILSGGENGNAKPGNIRFEGYRAEQGYQYTFEWSIGADQ